MTEEEMAALWKRWCRGLGIPEDMDREEIVDGHLPSSVHEMILDYVNDLLESQAEHGQDDHS